ncbi:hypothetical protein BC829DRAFT_239121 [Chytridium lagenaria]|nr:hypothetical protein BC829DRAFT_239121 [Chytridium lagenaria]
MDSVEDQDAIDTALRKSIIYVEAQCILVHKSPMGTIFEKTLYAESKRLTDAETTMTSELEKNTFRRELPFSFSFGSRALPPSFLLPNLSSSPAIVPPSTDSVPRDPIDGGLSPGIHWRLIAFIIANPAVNSTTETISGLTDPLNGGLRSLGSLPALPPGIVTRRPLIKTSLNLIVGYDQSPLKTITGMKPTPAPVESSAASTVSTSTFLSSPSPSPSSTIIKTLSSNSTVFKTPNFLKPSQTASRLATFRVTSTTPHEGDSTVSLLLNLHQDVLTSTTLLDITIHQLVKLRRPGNRSTLLKKCVVGGVTGLDLAAALARGEGFAGVHVDAALVDDEWSDVTVKVPLRGEVVEASNWLGSIPRPRVRRASMSISRTPSISSRRGSISSITSSSKWFGKLKRTASMSQAVESLYAEPINEEDTATGFKQRFRRRSVAVVGRSGFTQVAPSTPAVVTFERHVAVEVGYVVVVKVVRGDGDEAGKAKRWGGGTRRKVEEVVRVGIVVGSPEMPVSEQPSLSLHLHLLSPSTLSRQRPHTFEAQSLSQPSTTSRFPKT